MSHNFAAELSAQFGTTIDAAQVKAYAKVTGVSYNTITRHLEQYKVKRLSLIHI